MISITIDSVSESNQELTSSKITIGLCGAEAQILSSVRLKANSCSCPAENGRNDDKGRSSRLRILRLKPAFSAEPADAERILSQRPVLWRLRDISCSELV